MEEGKYYLIFYSTRYFYIKFHEDVPYKSFKTYYWLRDIDKLWRYHGSFNYSKMKNYKEVLLSDFVEYLPSDNTDKILFLRKNRLQLLLNYENI